MVPLLHHHQKIKQLVADVGRVVEPHALELLRSRKVFQPLLGQVIRCNEITGIGFHRTKTGVRCIPQMIEGFVDDDKIIQDIFPENSIHYDDCDLKIKFHHRSFWTYEDLLTLRVIMEYEHDPMVLVQKSLTVANRVLQRSPVNLSVVCGPISTGNLRTPQENLTIFNQSIYLLSRVTDIFNQMPFEQIFGRVHALIKDDPAVCPDGSSSKFFIDNFYREIFTNAKQWYPYFLEGWKHSKGATEEHSIFLMNGRKPNYLDLNFHEQLF